MILAPVMPAGAGLDFSGFLSGRASIDDRENGQGLGNYNLES